MSDLISRSALIENLREIKTLYGVPMTNRDEQMIHWIIGHIKEQPTAYNVDKVVAELESLSNAEADYYYATSNDVIDRENAIDIVKRGGVE